jgi:hypothetical protein
MKLKKCPFCNGTQGFKITIWLGGHEDKTVSFSGKVIDIEREGTDDPEKFATCLTCDKQIPIDNLNTQNV